MTRRVSLGVVGALLLTAMSPVATRAAADTRVEIRVLSNRADLVSGGDALVEIALTAEADGPLTVERDGTDISAAFERRANGRIIGLVDGLADGTNVITATFPDGSGARLAITNHPIGGPVFSGPQVQPWVCETERAELGPPQDEQCNAPTTVKLLYKSTSGAGFLPYDPAAPPPDVAEVTTDEGVTVPYVVRRERGTINRAIYEFAVLVDPTKPWEPWAPQAAWNEKLYYYFDGGAAPQRRQGTLLDEVMIDRALRRGYVVAYATLNRFGFNTNSVTSAETALMVKEKIVETLGPIRFTIGQGGSGGSIQQHLIAEGYPGLLDGIQVGASFQDVWTANSEAQDCSLLVRYFTETSPQLWLDPAQQAAVAGTADELPGTCRAIIAFWLDRLLGNPVEGLACHNSNGVGPGTPQTWAYHPELNPTGARCTLQDHQIAMFGRRPPEVWSDAERAAGGFANRPYDNVGIQYGLQALEDGVISIEQFLDLNEKIGGRDIDGGWQAARSEADPLALGVAYRTGQVNSGRGLASTPTFDLRNCSNNEFHTCFHTFVMRARVEKTNGNADGHVIFLQESNDLSLPLLDPWVTDIKADPTGDSLPAKVSRHRPADAVDSCWIDDQQVTDMTTCRDANPYFGLPRLAAGGPFTDDVLKCQLRTPSRTDYGVTFDDEQWERLRAMFPAGVCDWSKPSVGFQPSVPWLTFLGANGEAVPGGAELGPPPTSEPLAGGAEGDPDGPGTLPATGGWPVPMTAAVLAGLAIAGRALGRRATR